MYYTVYCYIGTYEAICGLVGHRSEPSGKGYYQHRILLEQDWRSETDGSCRADSGDITRTSEGTATQWRSSVGYWSRPGSSSNSPCFYINLYFFLNGEVGVIDSKLYNLKGYCQCDSYLTVHGQGVDVWEIYLVFLVAGWECGIAGGCDGCGSADWVCAAGDGVD